MARARSDHEIDGTAKEVTGQMVGDADLEAAGRHERRGEHPTGEHSTGEQGAAHAHEAGEAVVATVAGTVKEALGRALGVCGLARRGRRERLRRRGPVHRGS